MAPAMISHALQAEILRLHHSEGWAIGTIARQLRVHHDTVRRVLTQAGVPAPKAVRAAIVEPYRGFIAETLKRYPRLRASRLFVIDGAKALRAAIEEVFGAAARFSAAAPTRSATSPSGCPSNWQRRSRA